MEKRIDLERLKDFFDADDIEWKPIAVSKKTGKGLAAAYLTNRAIMDRLDEVCGPENWRNEFQEGPRGGVICGLSIRVGDEWVTKWDGAENTDIEPVKGGLSSAMRRAAVQWGIGRYLYRLPSIWVPVDERGRFQQPPRVPASYLPSSRSGDGAASSRLEAPVPAPQRPSQEAAPERRSAKRPRPAAQPAQQSRPDEQPQQSQPSGPEQRTKGPSEPKQTRRGGADEYFMPKDLPF